MTDFLDLKSEKEVIAFNKAEKESEEIYRLSKSTLPENTKKFVVFDDGELPF